MCICWCWFLGVAPEFSRNPSKVFGSSLRPMSVVLGIKLSPLDKTDTSVVYSSLSERFVIMFCVHVILLHSIQLFFFCA